MRAMGLLDGLECKGELLEWYQDFDEQNLYHTDLLDEKYM